jgi:hypothetical protein
MTTGEQLKRIRILLNLDQMQGHPDLRKHFREYLAILTANNLSQMILAGGPAIIENIAHWHDFEAGDALLQYWLDCATSLHSPQSILEFAESQIQKGHYLVISELLEKSLKSQDWAEDRLAGEVLRCAALEKLREGFAKPEALLKTEQAKTQAGWVATSFGIEKVNETLRQSIDETQRTFAGISQPTKQQIALKRQLDGIEKSLAGSGQTNP